MWFNAVMDGEYYCYVEISTKVSIHLQFMTFSLLKMWSRLSRKKRSNFKLTNKFHATILYFIFV